MEEDAVIETYEWEGDDIFDEEETDNMPNVQPTEKNFEKYDKMAFVSFRNVSICKEENVEKIFKAFRDWLVTYQTEGFLYTFEPKPDTAHLSLGKCPFLHTGVTSEERIDQMKQLLEEDKMKEEVEEFLRKRLRLVQKLLIVYKKAKRGVEAEYLKNLSSKDPYCNVKRKIATKRIVDMMIKQFALEYLYLKSMKVKKEIEVINCIFIDTDRMRHLRNVQKYTLRTAEKLRCLLEKECNSGVDEPEAFYEESTLKDMARMYLNEIENIAASEPHITWDEWSSEHFWEGTSESDGGVDDLERLSDLIESSLTQDNVQRGSEETSDDLSSRIDRASAKGEAAVHEESRTLTAEGVMSNKNAETLSNLDEEAFKTVPPEESHNVIDDIKKEILKPSYFEPGEDYEAAFPAEEEGGEEAAEKHVRLSVQLETNKEQIEILEEFKRELWLLESFHYFTTKVRPHLAGRYSLVHFKSKYEFPPEAECDVETSTSTESDSTIDSDLNNCLLHINNAKYISTKQTYKPADRDPELIEEFMNTLENSSSSEELLIVSEQAPVPIPNGSLYFSPSNVTNFTQKGFISNTSVLMLQARSVLESRLESTSSGFDAKDWFFYDSFRGRSDIDWRFSKYKHDYYSNDWSKLRSDSFYSVFNRNSRVVNADDAISELQQVSHYSIDSFNRKLDEVDMKEDGSIPSRVQSIPSFSGSLPDPLKIYDRCLKERALGIDDQTANINLFDSVSIDIRSPHSMEPEESLISEMSNKESRISSMSKAEKKAPDRFDSLNSVSGKNHDNIPDEQADESKKNKCFPTLLDIIKHFTKALKGKSNTSQDNTTQEQEEEEDYLEEGAIPEWDELMNIKWKCPVERRSKGEITECKIDCAEFVEQLRKSNKQYMRNHPEMAGMISLILREFSMKRPQNDFVKFIRDIVFNKHFAKRLSDYLATTNKCYQRRNDIDLEKRGQGLKSGSRKMFTFDKQSLDYWWEWEVDFDEICRRFGPKSEATVEEAVVDEEGTAEPSTDPWNLGRLLDKFISEDKAKEKSPNKCLDWARIDKKVAQGVARDEKTETTCVTALANEMDWGATPDHRSSCQRLFLKRYDLRKKK